MNSLVERENILVCNLVFKVDYLGRVDGNAHETRFEMKMWAGTATGIASESYRLSGLDPLDRKSVV